MGYKKMVMEDLESIFKRWHNGQKSSHIAEYESRDRKTIRRFISKFIKQGYLPGCCLPEKQVLQKFLLTLLPSNKRKAAKQESLSAYTDEIHELLSDEKEPLDMLHSFQVIQSKYQWNGSYETFKLFVKKNHLSKNQQPETIRIELPPGQEIQIDYGKVGLLHDKNENKNKTVYAFCGILSHSRLPFIRFEYRQNEESFIHANIKMLEFYEGTTDFISLDNLKSGVIKPELYDPKINRAYQEFADHYGVFINPCRVRKPKDKGKIERFIRPARQLFRTLKKIHPFADIVELSKHALVWCREEYGMKEHGTTHIPPMVLFEQEEKKTLKTLPEIRFEIPKWKNPKVGPDQFISFEKKYYSLPPKYKGNRVWVKRVTHLISIYYEYELIRTYIVPTTNKAYYKEDFPEVKNEMMDNGYVTYLLNQSRKYGEESYKLVESILSPHAFLNIRRAQGILGVLEKYYREPKFKEVCLEALGRNIKIPKQLKMLFNDAQTQMELPIFDGSSETGKEMTREIDYFWNDLRNEDKKLN